MGHIAQICEGQHEYGASQDGGEGQGTKAVFANFALFRLRDDPESRLRVLLNKLVGGDSNERAAIGGLFSDYFDGTKDSPYIGLISQFSSKGDDFAQRTVARALAHFPHNDQALEFGDSRFEK